MYGKCLELGLKRAAAFVSNARVRASSPLTKPAGRRRQVKRRLRPEIFRSHAGMVGLP
jgi:hypothetical protein